MPQYIPSTTINTPTIKIIGGFFFFWWDWGLNSDLQACKAGPIQLEHNSSSFCPDYFVSQTIWPYWPWTVTLLTSALQMARITGMSHQHPAPLEHFFFSFFFCGTGVWTQGLYLEPLHQPCFVKESFKIASHELFAWAGFDTPDLYLLNS
jgi:hypothetical protein